MQKEFGASKTGYTAQTELVATTDFKRESGVGERIDVSDVKETTSLEYSENSSLSYRFEHAISDLQTAFAEIHEALGDEECVRAAAGDSGANLREVSLRTVEKRFESEEALLDELPLLSHTKKVDSVSTPRTSARRKWTQAPSANAVVKTSNMQHSDVRGAKLQQSPSRSYLLQPDSSDISMNGTTNPRNLFSNRTSASVNVPSGGHHSMRKSASMNLPSTSKMHHIDRASGGSINVRVGLDSNQNQVASRPTSMKPNSFNVLSATNDKVVRGMDHPGARTSVSRRHIGACTGTNMPSRTTAASGSIRGSLSLPESNHRRAKQSSRLKEW